MNIHLIIAMQAEAVHLIKKLNLQKLAVEFKDGRNFDVFYAQKNNRTIRLFVNQKKETMDTVGTVPAALLTSKSIQFYKPDLILNIGTAGGIIAQDVRVFDMICAQNFLIYHDSFTGSDAKSLKQGLGFFPCIDYSTNSALKQFKHGVIASSNSIILNSDNWDVIHKYKVMCVDMEAAAVAQVAEEFQIPFSALKVVTDVVQEKNPIDTLPQFELNFHKSMEKLATSVAENFEAYSRVRV